MLRNTCLLALLGLATAADHAHSEKTQSAQCEDCCSKPGFAWMPGSKANGKVAHTHTNKEHCQPFYKYRSGNSDARLVPFSIYSCAMHALLYSSSSDPKLYLHFATPLLSTPPRPSHTYVRLLKTSGRRRAPGATPPLGTYAQTNSTTRCTKQRGWSQPRQSTPTASRGQASLCRTRGVL